MPAFLFDNQNQRRRSTVKDEYQIQQFYSEEFGSIDILMIDDKPYFCAAECARALGYKNPRDAILRHCRADGVAKRDGVSLTTNQHGATTRQTVKKTYISEGNLYRLIIRSQLSGAERFERWVFDEVLPTIRKCGAYITADTLDELLNNSRFTENLIRELDKEHQRSDTLEELATEMAPKALYCDLVLESKNTIPVSLIAKDYGMSAVAFNEMLHDFGVQYRIAGTWLLYQDYADKGYTKTSTCRFGTNGAALYTCWTQKGRMFLYRFLKKRGILPEAAIPALWTV
jgi:prophage antirepressor-like protein